MNQSNRKTGTLDKSENVNDTNLSEDRGLTGTDDQMEIEERHASLIDQRKTSKNTAEMNAQNSRDTITSKQPSILPMNRRVNRLQIVDNWLWVNN